MRYWRIAGALALLGLVAVLVLTTLGVHRVTVRERATGELPDFESMRVHVEEVSFPSTDGLQLEGWWMPAADDVPVLVLCHDLGASKRSVVNLAIALRSAGFSVLAFDFRGHGDSEGKRTSLGVLEKRDLLGALDWLADRDAGRVGVFGAGMGAHAAVLAAGERREATVLVLDGLYPDASFPLGRELYPSATWARRGLGFVADGVYYALHGTSPRSQRAADTVQALVGRHVLMLAPASDSALMNEMQEMVRDVPEEVDAEGNLVVVPATLGQGLYGDQLNRYHARVTEFFQARLPQPQGVTIAGW